MVSPENKDSDYRRTLSDSLTRLIEISNEYTLKVFEIRAKKLGNYFNRGQKEYSSKENKG